MPDSLPATDRWHEGATDTLWPALRIRAMQVAAREPLLGEFLNRSVTRWTELEEALAAVLAHRLADGFVTAASLSGLARTAFAADPAILEMALLDLRAIGMRDPAAGADPLTPFLHYKGFHALAWHRVAHHLWDHGREELARFIQGRVAQALAVDIHPAARFGHGVFIDHATGFVAGETTVVGNDVSILQGVTLGGTGKQRGDRHPKVGDGVLLGAGAKILGNIAIGRGAKVGAGSVVLHDVPPCATVAGVPAKIVGWCSESVPALVMDHALPES